MLITTDDKGKKRVFWIVDCHTHIGAEKVIEYGRKTFRKNSPHQILDFYKQTRFEVLRQWKRTPDKFAYDFSDNFVTPTPFFGTVSGDIHGNRYEGWFVDQFVSFPFNDAHREDEPPEFRIPNDMILKRMDNPAFTGRLLGFCRVNPFDGEPAVKEVERCIKSGIRGLKLHPISQKFLDQINEPPVQAVVKKALNGRLPVIFDCRFVKTAEDIYELYQNIKTDIRNPDHGIILAHSGMEFGKSALYEILADPHMYGDTSGMRSDDVSFFFKQAYAASPDTWFQNVIFGTDYNYFSAPQALDLIMYLFSRDLEDMTAVKPHEIQRILAGNLLRLIFPRQIESAGVMDWENSEMSGIKFLQSARMTPTMVSEAAEKIGHWFAENSREKRFELFSFDPCLPGMDAPIETPSFLVSFIDLKNNRLKHFFFLSKLVHPESEEIPVPEIPSNEFAENLSEEAQEIPPEDPSKILITGTVQIYPDFYRQNQRFIRSDAILYEVFTTARGENTKVILPEKLDKFLKPLFKKI